jgi:hypothetical protein
MTIRIAYDVKKLQFSQKILFGNPVATKKFPIKNLPVMIDSSVKNPVKVEYDKQSCLQLQKTQVR